MHLRSSKLHRTCGSEKPRYIDRREVSRGTTHESEDDREKIVTTITVNELRQPETNHFNFLFFKPFIWPVFTAPLGLMASLILLDVSTGSLKVALVAFAGGLFAGPLVNKIGQTFGFREQSF